MRVLTTSPTLVVLAILLAWSVPQRAQANRALVTRFLTRRAVLDYILLGACANVAVSALAGYINPKDYVQDVVAAHQFLRHRTLYPADLPRRGIDELSAAMPGQRQLQKLPFLQDELRNATFSPAPANAHPPLLGIVLAAPVFLLGLRGSFLFVFSLSVVLLCLTVAAILRELFPHLPRAGLCAAMGLVFGWYPVAACLREGQPAIILFALITAAWLMLRRDRPWLAGGAIGLAACLHAFPALLTLFFAIRYRRAFVSAVGVIALLSLAAAAVTVQGTFQEWLSTVHMVARGSVPGFGNLSIAGLIGSFSRGIGWGEHVTIMAPAVLLLTAVGLVLFLRPWNPLIASPARLDVEYSVFVAAMLLASPLTWARYLPIMLLPLGVLIRNGRCRRPAWPVSALLAALTLLSFSTSACIRAFHLFSAKLGFIAGWLAISAPSFAMIAILFWLASSHCGEATRRWKKPAASD